jgi:uncharacterized membrane protein
VAREERIDLPSGPERLTILVDGVFAIAMTVLVLPLATGAADGTLAITVAGVLPRMIAFALSFVSLGYFWIAHHNTFRHVHVVDRAFLWLNLILALFVATLPFSAAVLGSHLLDATALSFYGANLIGIALCHYALTGRAIRRGLTRGTFTPRLRRLQRRRVLGSVGPYLAAALVSPVLPALSLAIFVLVPVGFAIWGGRIDREVRPVPHAAAPRTDAAPPRVE